jgi:predicted metal-dependent hydrolase
MASDYPAQDLRRKVYTWAMKLKVNPKDIRIQILEGKWGTCSSDGVVTFAADLLDQDESFQDYVIVHELTHLKVQKHGKLFTSLVATHIPNYKEFQDRKPEKDL